MSTSVRRSASQRRLLLLVALEIGLRRIPNDYAYKNERLVRDGAGLRFLVLGSSHAYRGVEPDSMGGAGFNAANISQDLSYDRAVLEHYLPHLPKLEYIVLPVSYGSLGGRLELGAEAWRVKNYTLYMGIDKDASNIKHYVELLNRPVRDEVRMLRRYLTEGKDNRVCGASGAATKTMGAASDLDRSGEAAAARHTHPSTDRMDFGRKELKALVQLATEHGVHVFLFAPPAWRTYRDRLDSAQLHGVITTCEQLDREHAEVDYIDLLADPRFIKSDFADADHVSAAGQAKLSRILRAWIDSARTATGPVPLPGNDHP